MVTKRRFPVTFANLCSILTGLKFLMRKIWVSSEVDVLFCFLVPGVLFPPPQLYLSPSTPHLLGTVPHPVQIPHSQGSCCYPLWPPPNPSTDPELGIWLNLVEFFNWNWETVTLQWWISQDVKTMFSDIFGQLFCRKRMNLTPREKQIWELEMEPWWI